MSRTGKTRVGVAWGVGVIVAAGALAHATTAGLEPWLVHRKAPDPIALLLTTAIAMGLVFAGGVVTWAVPRLRPPSPRPEGRLAMRIASRAGGAALFGAALAALDGSLATALPPGMIAALVGLDSLFAIAAAAVVGGVVLFLRPLVSLGLRAGVIASAGAVGLVWFSGIAWSTRGAYVDHSGLAWLPIGNALLTAQAGAAVYFCPAIVRTRWWGRWRRVATLSCGVVGLLSVPVVWPLVSATADELDLLQPVCLLAGAALAWVAGRTLGRWKLTAAALLLPFCLGWASRPLEERQDLASTLLRDPPVAQAVFRVLRMAGDFDMDGYAAWLGGGDCAPFDASRHPFARELLDNGIDEDCSGADLRRTALDATDYREGSRDVADVPQDGTPDIVLVVVDTLRARALGAHGATPSNTPVMDALATESLLFEQAYCLCPATHRALPPLLTGLLPTELTETYADRRQALSDERVTLFEALAERGYESQILFSEKFLRDRNLAQGATIHDEGLKGNAVERPRTRTARRLVREWSERPKFFWLHLSAPHGPHKAPPGFPPRDDSEQAAYEAEIRLTEEQLTLFLETLRETPRGRNAFVILTSDHGEEMYEHGRSRHARTLYEEVMHVPLMISGPGVVPGRVATPVDHLDLATTIAALGGRFGFGTGRDLRAAFAGGRLPPRPVILELFPMRSNRLTTIAVIVDRKKLILDLENRAYEYYDLSLDPLERDNRFDAAPDEVAPLKRILLGHVERIRALR